MDKTEEFQPWLDIAAQDLDTAIYLEANMHPSPDEIICFLCQQSAEKHLKAFLVINNIEPPRIHDLIKLLSSCNDINSSFSELRIKCVVLNQYGVMPRYPNELQITEADVRVALQYARDIKDFIVKVLK
jgi:HEPN domain-containing protein